MITRRLFLAALSSTAIAPAIGRESEAWPNDDDELYRYLFEGIGHHPDIRWQGMAAVKYWYDDDGMHAKPIPASEFYRFD